MPYETKENPHNYSVTIYFVCGKLDKSGQNQVSPCEPGGNIYISFRINLALYILSIR